VLDAALMQDPHSRVACEALAKNDTVVLAGEVTSRAQLDLDVIVRKAVREVGYGDPAAPFCADTLRIDYLLSRQSHEIGHAVQHGEDQGAGDQGIMFGYATDETGELMPLPVLLAHRLSRGLAQDRKEGRIAWLRPDAKTQVSVLYEDNRPVRVDQVLVSTQHLAGISQAQVQNYVRESLAPRELGDWFHPGIRFHVNPSGSFVEGGPSADCGLTGRKIIVDTYGGFARNGGGAFSGKDPSKVDRSGAYFCRYVARQIVLRGLASRAEVQVAYAIGQAKPVSVLVDTFGTGDARAAEAFASRFDFRPAAIIERLGLLQPLYRKTTNYGHFGKLGLPWETGEIDGRRQADAPPDLEAAYRSTTFGVETDSGIIYIRPGVANRLLDCLLAEHEAHSWAYITAHNPGSRLLTAQENAVRHHRLVRHVEERGLTHLPGQGVGDGGDWPAEESLLVLDVTEEHAVALGAEFGQNAVVFGRRGDAPHLLRCLPAESK
jgi:S-adenosylmethionine synthetase